MKLFFDRDIGKAVPQALQLVRYSEIEWLDRYYHHRPAAGQHVADIEWLQVVGSRGWLAISENKRMLNDPDERQTLIDSGVGIVFLDSAQETAMEVLAFMLRRRTWLMQIHDEPRPFAYITSLRGRARAAALA